MLQHYKSNYVSGTVTAAFFDREGGLWACGGLGWCYILVTEKSTTVSNAVTSISVNHHVASWDAAANKVCSEFKQDVFPRVVDHNCYFSCMHTTF